MKTGLFLALAVFAIVVTARWSEAAKVQRQDQLVQVFKVCNESRMILSPQAEIACGDIQEATKTEFLCQTNDGNPQTVCWVEDKQ